MPIVDVENMTSEQRKQYDHFPFNLARALLLMEPPLSAALPNLADAVRASSLNAKLREAVILRVAALQGSAYERMQHLGQARKVGWSDEGSRAIEQETPPAEIEDLMRFVDQTVETGDVSDAVFDAVRVSLSDADVATVLLLIGHYMMVARFTKVLGVEVDDHPTSFGDEH